MVKYYAATLHKNYAQDVRQKIFIEQITVTTDGDGDASVTSDNYINGELLAFVYDDGTVTAATTASVSTSTPVVLTLDSYDVNSGDVYRPMYIEGVNADLSSRYFLDSKIVVTVSGGQVSKTFYVYVVYR